MIIPNLYNVLVKISEDIRRLVFEKPITDVKGREFFMVTKVKEEKGMDEYFAQGVSVGEITAVGSMVTNMRVGDTVILDYVADVNDEYLVTQTDAYKIVSANAITEYETEDLILPANRNKPRPTIVHKKGELKLGSIIIAIIRDSIITPNSPYILMEHKQENVDEFYVKDGNVAWSRSKSQPIVERKVLFVHEGCDISVGDTVIIEEDAIFSRALGDSDFDVAYSHDVIAIEALN